MTEGSGMIYASWISRFFDKVKTVLVENRSHADLTVSMVGDSRAFVIGYSVWGSDDEIFLINFVC